VVTARGEENKNAKNGVKVNKFGICDSMWYSGWVGGTKHQRPGWTKDLGRPATGGSKVREKLGEKEGKPSTGEEGSQWEKNKEFATLGAAKGTLGEKK